MVSSENKSKDDVVEDKNGELTAHIQDVLDGAIGRHAIPGGAVAVITPDSPTPLFISAGRQTYDTSSPLVDEHTVYDVASITKLAPTTLLAMRLIEVDEMDIDAPIAQYLEAYRGGYRQEITVKHLLSHAVDWGFSLASLKDAKADEILHAIFTAHPRSVPGISIHYSNISSLLLGLIIERAYLGSLAEAAQLSIFGPLRMESTTFYPLSQFDPEQIAPTEIDDWRGGEVRGVVHDESAYVLSQAGLTVGSAGLFSTASDMSKIAKLLVSNGSSNGEAILSTETVPQMAEIAFPKASPSMGLGLSVGPSDVIGQKMPASVVYKTGFTGCLVAADLESNHALVFLSNHTYPHRQPDKMVRNDLFRKLCSEVFTS